MLGSRMKKVRKVLWLILLANVGVAAVKIIAGQMIQSASLTADGFHSLTDGVSNVVGLIGIWFAAQPVDENHPYGHRKYEFVTGLFIGFMLLLIAIFVVQEATGKFLQPVAPNITPESLAALVITLVVNVAVCLYEYQQGKKLCSPVLISDSLHTRSDVYVSISVLATLIGIRLGMPPFIDPLASLVVAVFIIRAAVEIIRSTSSVLVDSATVDTERIREIVMGFAAVCDVHDIRSRGSEQELYIDMHVLIDPTMELEASHQLSHELTDKIREELHDGVRVMIHMEPFRKEEAAGGT